MAGIVWKYIDAEERKRLALAEADKVRRTSDFLTTILVLHGANAQCPPQVLDETEQQMQEEFAARPELQARLRAALIKADANIHSTLPMAMILEVRGDVKLQSPQNPQQRPLPQMLLYGGDRLSLRADSQIRLVVLSDLHQEVLRSGRQALVCRKGCFPADAVLKRDDSITMSFVRLRKGRFYMGLHGLPGSATETDITEDFEIAVHDVTQGEWQAVMGSNPSTFSRTGGERDAVKDISDYELKLFPVENVSWNDAQEFIKKLNEKESGRGYVYRLPTEAQWEYACRDGGASSYSYHFYFGKPTDKLSSEQANFNGNFPFGGAPTGQFLQRPTRVAPTRRTSWVCVTCMATYGNGLTPRRTRLE